MVLEADMLPEVRPSLLEELGLDAGGGGLRLAVGVWEEDEVPLALPGDGLCPSLLLPPSDAAAID